MEEETDYDYMSSILDEIALEGLDGITVPSLWKRLDKRQKFPFSMDSDSKSFIWNCIVPDENLEFFELPEPRTPLVIFNRYQNMDMEFGIVVEHEEEIPDPYPYVPVEDKNMKGSCSNFKTRINVTHLIRDKTSKAILMSLQDLFLKWSREQLIIVASQTKRNLALLGSDVSPSTSFGLIQFCLLERIARSRHHGEVTCGKNSLACLKLPPKTLFYYRKVLLANKIIVKQYHYQKSKEGQLVKGSLLQLARFYVERKSKMEMLIINMCKTLESKPKKEEEFGKLRGELGLKPAMFKKMFGKIFQTCVKVKVVTSSVFYPDLPKDQHFSQNGKERLIKVVELVKPYDDHEDDDVDDDDEKLVTDEKQVHFSPSKIAADRPVLCQALKVIDDAGPDGANAVAIGKAMGLPKLETRALLRVLDKKGVVITVMQDSGRQRSLQFISKRFEDESKAHKRVLEMHRKLMNYTAEAEENQNLPTSLETVDFSDDLNNMAHMDVSVQASSQDAPRKPSKSWSFSLKDINNINNKLNVPSFTYRMLKRANRIIELVKEYKVFDQLYKIQKKITEEEAEEGVVEKLDRASFTRIVHRLAKDGYIQSIKTILNFDKTTRKMHLICDRSVTPDDPLIKRAIDETKMRYISGLGHAEHKAKEDKREEKENEPLSLSKPESEINFEYCPSMGKIYGFQPKCIRMKTLHELVCYLVYFHEGSETPISLGKDGSPPVYVDCQDWRRFLHPIAKRPELKEGFVYFADLMHCVPASLLVTIVNFNYKITGFEEILKDEEKKNYLIQHFPPEIRNGFIFHRKYIHSIHEVMLKLAFNGLVSFVTQKMKEKEKSLIYVRRNTCLSDTSSSNPGYLHVTRKEYAKINYEFRRMEDVCNYWMNVERISLHTPLGMYGNDKDQTVTIFDVYHKPELEEASKPKEINDIVDDFKVPGDSLGACGFDSAMYFHLKRNWNWPSISVRTNRPATKKVTLPINIVGSNYISYLASNEEQAQNVGPRKRLGKFLKKTVPLKNMENKESSVSEAIEVESVIQVQEPVASGFEKRRVLKPPKTLSNTPVSIGAGNKKRKMKPIVRVIGRNYKKAKKPYYDEADKVALNKMTKLRVTWTAQEDSFLLLCKVASCFLDPYYKMVVPYSVVRDLIQEHLPNLSLNKSSRACQRRILYMLKNPLTVTNVSVYLGEANQDTELVKQFQGPKPNRNQDSTWKSMFTEVLKYLLNKFTSKTLEVAEKFALPDSVDDFKNKYQVSESGSLKCKKNIHVTPKNTIDIHCSVVFSVVLQGLNCVGDKTNWSFTLYKIYQCYPDTLLRSVIAKLKHEGIITKRKEISKREEVAVPFSAMPHRLSSKFEFILQGKYRNNLFQDSYNFFNKLLRVSRESTELEISPNIDGYETAILATYVATKNVKITIKVPEQIIVFDKKVTEEFKQKLYEKTSGQKSEGTSDIPAPAKASRFALYMMRHDLTEPLQGFQVVQHSHDSFLINSCKLSAILEPSRGNQLVDEEILDLDVSVVTNLIDSQKVLLSTEDQEILTQDDLIKFYQMNEYSPEEAEVGWEIYSAILNKKEIGCTIADLFLIGSLMDSEVSLFDHLKVLMNHEAVIGVGVVQRNYVAQFYAGPWILNSVKIPKENRSLATEVALLMKSYQRPNPNELETENSEALEALREGVDHEKSFMEPPLEPPEKSKRKLSTEDQDSDETAAKKARVEDNDEDPGLISIWLNESVLNQVCQISSETLEAKDDKLVSPSSESAIPMEFENSSNNMVESEVLRWLEENVLNKVHSEAFNPKPVEPMDIPEVSNQESRIDTLNVKERVSLKSWLEAKVTREVEALHQTANKSAGDSSSVAEINRWLQESIVKKLEDKCSVADIKLWFQKCILEKVENQSAINDLQQWFQDSVLRTLEDQTFLNDLEIMRQAEEERIIELRDSQLQQNQESLELIDSQVEQEQESLEIKDSQQGQEARELNDPQLQQCQETQELVDPQLQQCQDAQELVDPQLQQGQEAQELNDPQLQQCQETQELVDPQLQQCQDAQELVDPQLQQGQEAQELNDPQLQLQQCQDEQDLVDAQIQQCQDAQELVDSQLQQCQDAQELVDPQLQQGQEALELVDPQLQQGQEAQELVDPQLQQGQEAQELIDPQLQGQEAQKLVDPQLQQGQEAQELINPNLQHGQEAQELVDPQPQLQQDQEALELRSSQLQQDNDDNLVSQSAEVQQWLEDNLSKVEDKPETSQTTLPVKDQEYLELMEVDSEVSQIKLLVSYSVQVQQWLEDILTKVASQTTEPTQAQESLELMDIGTNDSQVKLLVSESVEVQQWLRDNLRKVEDEKETSRTTEPIQTQESLELMDVSTNDSQVKLLVSESVEVQQWLRDNLRKVEDEKETSQTLTPILENLTQWFEENILEKIREREVQEDLRHWLNDAILKKVDDANLASELKECMENSLLTKIEDKIEPDDLKRWFEEKFTVICSLHSLRERVKEVREEEEEIESAKWSKELKVWFDKTLVEKVENQEIKREVTNWFDSKVLTTIEALSKIVSTTLFQEGDDVPLNKLKIWLNREIISRITDAEDVKDLLEGTILPEVVDASNLRKWLEDEILTIVEEMDYDDSNVLEISDLLLWFDENILLKVNEIKDEVDLKSWLEDNVSKMMEDSVEVNNVLSEATVSILSCLKDVVAKVDKTEAKPLDNLDIINVVCCLKDVISKVDDREIKRVKKEELRKWFEERIFKRVLEKSKSWHQEPLLTLDIDRQSQPRILDIDKDISELLETEVLSKIDEGIDKLEEVTKMVTRRRRKRTYSSTTSNVTLSRSFHCDPIKFISRIWKKPDGGLNRPILRKLLSSVLSHIMSNPGISEKQIFEKFEMCMPPVQLLDLLEMLKEIGCVECIFLKQSRKPGIFNDQVKYSITETLNAKDYFQTITYYEATVYAVVKLGKFIQELIISH